MFSRNFRTDRGICWRSISVVSLPEQRILYVNTLCRARVPSSGGLFAKCAEGSDSRGSARDGIARTVDEFDLRKEKKIILKRRRTLHGRSQLESSVQAARLLRLYAAGAPHPHANPRKDALHPPNTNTLITSSSHTHPNCPHLISLKPLFPHINHNQNVETAQRRNSRRLPKRLAQIRQLETHREIRNHQSLQRHPPLGR